MKKFYLLTKTLLVAVCLLVGASNAWAQDAGTYYIQNVGTGKWLAPGNSWETQASVLNHADKWVLAGSEGTYTLESVVSNGSGKIYLNGGYCDGTTNSLTFTAIGGKTNTYSIKEGTKYYTTDGTTASATADDASSENAQWKLYSLSDLTTLMASATPASGVDATFFIKDHNLSRNNRDYSAWSNTGATAPKTSDSKESGTSRYSIEAFQKTFDVHQSLTSIPNGVYGFQVNGFYRQDGSDKLPYLYAGDNKVTLPARTGSENDMQAAAESFVAGNYLSEQAKAVVTNGNLTVGVGTEGASCWTIFKNFHLTYYGTALINDAKAFNNGGVMAAGQWYYFDATVAGTYEFSAGSDLTAISYTTDGTQVTSSATGTTLTASQTLSVTRYYFKSSSAQTLTVAVPTGAQIVNADIDFSNAISDGAVAGNLNSMVLSNTASSYKYELGYTSGTPATTVLGDVLRVGNGTGTVTIPDAQLAGERDEVIISFDMWFGYLNAKDAGFYLYDNAGTPAVIGNLYLRQNGTTSDANNMFGLDVAKINHIGGSGTENEKICVNSNKTTFIIHLDYSTNTMYVEQSTDGTLKQTTTPVSLGSSNPLKRFEVRSNYQNDGRRCWFDNLHIYTIRGDYSVVPVGYTLKFQDTEGNTVKADDTSRSALAGTAISTLATTADKTTFYNDGDIANNNTVEFAGATNKYVFKSISAVTSSSDDTPVDEVTAAGNVVTIVYDKYNKYNYTIKQKLGTADATSLQSNSLWQDQTLTYYYTVCVKDGDDYYVTEKNVSTPYFGVVVTKDNANPVINYTQDDRIVYYVESEDMAGSRYSYSQSPSRTSGGKSWCSTNATNSYLATNWTLDAGSYDIEVGMANREYAVSPVPQLKSSTDDETPVNLTAISLAASSYTVKNYTSQAIATDEQLYFYNDNGSNASKWALDYVILRKLPTTVTATITPAGWSSFASPYALDLNSLTASEGTATAYYASAAEGSEVTLTPTTAIVPAGTGIMLKGTAGATVSIPVTSDAPTFDETNLLKGQTTTGNVAASTAGKYHYVFGYESSSVYGFYNLASDTEVPAGKAYLETTTELGSASARAISIVLADDILTGINEAEAATEAVQKEGKFVVDGKLVIFKKGMKFNANGARIY